MRQKLAGDRQDTLPYRHFATGISGFGSRIGFRFADGRRKSLPYTQLVETEYNPDVGIILEFIGHRVTLTGRNLVRLYAEFEDEVVGEVTERHAHEMMVPDTDLFVAGIMWERI